MCGIFIKNYFHVFRNKHNTMLQLGIIDLHYALIITPLFITPTPTCFGTYMPSSGSVLYPYELVCYTVYATLSRHYIILYYMLYIILYYIVLYYNINNISKTLILLQI
jgi:hypothetical protein